MRTRLTEMLGIEHPVMLAGMGGVSYAVLVVFLVLQRYYIQGLMLGSVKG